jgi:FtsP/CotA-like multicopper oxidase with cupredoxin domain
VALLLLLGTASAHAAIDGLTGTTFNFTAKPGFINTGEGNIIFMWGFANGSGPMQYPGPTLIVNEGATVTINLTNQLSVPVSIVFPGQSNVIATGGTPGAITNEAAAFGDTVSYTFTASQPGTYTYYSGTDQDLQIEMGLFGAIIVRPFLGSNYAYNNEDTFFNREFLFFISEIDPVPHQQVALGQTASVNTTDFFPVYWFFNGRNAPDTMAPAISPLFPNQPYNCMVRFHPGEKVLLRMIGGGRDLHPLHTHGNHHKVIARDGRLLESAPGSGPDLGEFAFTTTVIPGSTADAIFVWTGDDLGWDIYGHQPGDPLAPAECVFNGVQNPADPRCSHGGPVPVELPNIMDLTPGEFWNGSAFIGQSSPLPPGHVSLNPTNALTFMWHSHSEKELTNNDIFPGGALTMAFIEHPSVIIEPGNP